jgi:ketosteroid isomerase-like protein
MAATDVAAERSTQLDPAFVDDFVRRFYEGWNALDGDAVAALCTEDVLWDEPIIPRAARGRDEVAAFVTATREASPDFHIERLSPAPYISATEPKVLQPYRMTATQTGVWSYTGLLPTGYRVDAPAIDEWTFRGELMCHYVTYYDTLDTCRQLSNMPPWGWIENGEKRGSAGDRMLTGFTNLNTRLTKLFGRRPKGPFPRGYEMRR